MNKINKYRELEDKVLKEQAAIKEIEKRLELNCDTVSQGEGQLPALKDKIANAVAEGHPMKEVEALENDYMAVDKSINRAMLGVNKMKAILQKRQKNLSALHYERDTFFNQELSIDWLIKEAKLYDDAYDKLFSSLRRILACQDLMIQRPDGLEYWRSALGEASNYFAGMLVVRINDFNLDQVRSIRGLMMPSQKVRDNVQAEILGG